MGKDISTTDLTPQEKDSLSRLAKIMCEPLIRMVTGAKQKPVNSRLWKKELADKANNERIMREATVALRNAGPTEGEKFSIQQLKSII